MREMYRAFHGTGMVMVILPILDLSTSTSISISIRSILSQVFKVLLSSISISILVLVF